MTSLVPAKAARQSHCGVRGDGMDSFVNNVLQGPGLRFSDSPGDVFIMQKTCREKTTWLLVWQSAINHRHLLRGSGESGWIKCKVKMWCAGFCKYKNVTATVIYYDWLIDGYRLDFMKLTMYFLFFWRFFFFLTWEKLRFLLPLPPNR